MQKLAQQPEQAMPKANVVYEGASPGDDDAKEIALWNTMASSRDVHGTWMCEPCLEEETQGRGDELGETTCGYHAYNCAELQCINSLMKKAQKSGGMSAAVRHHMEGVLETAKEHLMGPHNGAACS